VGDTSGGSADKRGEVGEADGSAVAPTRIADIPSVGRAIDEAQEKLRSGKVDPELLKALGMTQPQFKTFIEQYAQKYGQLKQMLDRTRRPTNTVQDAYSLPGSDRLARGQTVAGDLGQTSGAENLTTDNLRKLYESPAAKVSPEYRKQVEAYFRAISESANRPTPTSGPGN